MIGTAILKWFTERGIQEGNLKAMGVYTERQHGSGDDNVIIFPYFVGNQIVNRKYRGNNKEFRQDKDGEKVFYNVNVLDDPALAGGLMPLTICEGEIDLLSVLEAGNPFVVSVPNGAPMPKEVNDEVPEPEEDKAFSYLVRDWDKLKRIKRIIIGTDDDPPGRRLAEELVRRLGRDRCSFIQWPEGCKDFNDVLVKKGMATVAELVATAKPYPVSGVYKYSELPPEPELKPVSTGFARLDQYLMPFYPCFMVVTGFAGSGKSTIANQMVAQLALNEGWKATIASFEMRIKPFVSDTLINVYCSKTNNDVDAAEKWIDDNFTFIAPEPCVEDDRYNIDWLIERAQTAVIRHGARVLLIDPWNEVEHALGRRESMTDYTGRAIRALKRFGREFECLVIVVAHPTKFAAQKDPADVTLYDISDTAHWANKADLGVVVARLEGTYVSEIFVKKVRYQPMTGSIGSLMVTYDPAMRLFGQ